MVVGTSFLVLLITDKGLRDGSENTTKELVQGQGNVSPKANGKDIFFYPFLFAAYCSELQTHTWILKFYLKWTAKKNVDDKHLHQPLKKIIMWHAQIDKNSEPQRIAPSKNRKDVEKVIIQFNVCHLTTVISSLSNHCSFSSARGHMSGLRADFIRLTQRRDSSSPGDPATFVDSFT